MLFKLPIPKESGIVTQQKMRFNNIDEYHSEQTEAIQMKLEQLRKAIQKAAPKAAETIGYGMPAFKQNKVLVYYAGYKSHIGFYPTPNAIVAFKAELTKYKTSKGAIQLPINQPLPLTLIKKLVRFRLKEDMQAASFNPKHITQKQPNVIHEDISVYNNRQDENNQAICSLLASHITNLLTNSENKVWHGHPVWFLDCNPIVGYSKQKQGIRLMFWSGADFDEPRLNVVGIKFKDASLFYSEVTDINVKELKRWLKMSVEIQ
jgi:uncharacterized protein YdhG (YjbR/CyaY superfamily)